jgi:hypothetical protein
VAIGAVFILVIVLIVLAVLAGGLYAIAMWLRHRQLDPENDEAVARVGEEHRERPDNDEAVARVQGEHPERPDHVKAENEQRARFVGGRRAG